MTRCVLEKNCAPTDGKSKRCVLIGKLIRYQKYSFR